MTAPRSLAAAQTVPVRGDVAANVAQHVRLVELAAGEQAQVLVFPELSLTGYEMELAKDLAFSEDDPRLSPLVEAATATSMTLIVGAPIRVESRLHIGAFILYPDLTRAIHTKSRLGSFSSDVNPNGTVPPAEDTAFEPGTLSPLVRVGGPLAAVGICAESLQPSPPREAAERGARTYLTSHFGIPADLELRLAVLRRYAVEHRMAVVFANYGGPTGGLAASGGSAILSASGEKLIQLGRQGAGVAVAIEEETGWRTKRIELDESER